VGSHIRLPLQTFAQISGFKVQEKDLERTPKKLNAKGHGDVFFISFPFTGGITCPVNRGTHATPILILYHTVAGAPIYRGLALHYV